MGYQVLPNRFAEFSKPKILRSAEQVLSRDVREQAEDKRRDRRDILISILIVVFFLTAGIAFSILHFPDSSSPTPASKSFSF